MTIKMTVIDTSPSHYEGQGESPVAAIIALLTHVSNSVDLDFENLATLLTTIAEALVVGEAAHNEMGGDDEFTIIVNN